MPGEDEASALVSRSVTAAERLLAPLFSAYRSISSMTSKGRVNDILRLVTGPLDTARGRRGHTISVAARAVPRMRRRRPAGKCIGAGCQAPQIWQPGIPI